MSDPHPHPHDGPGEPPHHPHGPGQGRAPASEHPPTSAEHWDERYSGEPTRSGDSNGALIAEVADLAPGRALDIGCGEGADAVWLAQHGWTVTALDISPNAVALTRAAAERAGVEVTGIAAPFTEAELAPAGSTW